MSSSSSTSHQLAPHPFATLQLKILAIHANPVEARMVRPIIIPGADDKDVGRGLDPDQFRREPVDMDALLVRLELVLKLGELDEFTADEVALFLWTREGFGE